MQIGAWQKRTLYNILCFRGLCSKVVIPTGLEPISKEPESFILSIKLWDPVWLEMPQYLVDCGYKFS